MPQRLYLLARFCKISQKSIGFLNHLNVNLSVLFAQNSQGASENSPPIFQQDVFVSLFFSYLTLNFHDHQLSVQNNNSLASYDAFSYHTRCLLRKFGDAARTRRSNASQRYSYFLITCHLDIVQLIVTRNQILITLRTSIEKVQTAHRTSLTDI